MKLHVEFDVDAETFIPELDIEKATKEVFDSFGYTSMSRRIRAITETVKVREVKQRRRTK